jgi:adenine-specific DNA-methyltransferase
VVGNPPYIRYQEFNGAARLKALKAASAQDVSLTNLASSWAAFTIHAARFVKPDGRLGLVLPAELLSVNYAAPVRAYLLRRFSRIKLVLFRERIFPGVSEEVLLLLAEGEGPVRQFEVLHAKTLADIEDWKGVSWSSVPMDFNGKWSAALLPGEASSDYDRIAGDTNSFVPLLQWGDPTLGMVTGNNKYFTLTRAQACAWGLGDGELLAISPPGSRHLRGLCFSSQDWQRLYEVGQPVFLFRPSVDNLSSAAKAFVKAGEDEGVPEAYKCRIRRPWWRVPLVPAPDLFFTYMNHDAPRLVANGAGARHLNSVHGLRLQDETRALGLELLPLAMLNSVTLLGAELVGRSYGGGILKMEPKEADRLPVPSVDLIGSMEFALRALRDDASRLLLERRLNEVVDLVDNLLLVGRLKLSPTELRRLQQARLELFGRRTARH